MRRKLAMVMAIATMVATAVCMTGCSGDSGKENGTDNGKESTKEIANGEDQEQGDADATGKSDASGETDADEKQEESGSYAYKKYDDFTTWERINMTDIYFDYPYWRADSQVGSSINDSMVTGWTITKDGEEHEIIVATNMEAPYTGDIDNILEQTYPEFLEIVDDAVPSAELEVTVADVITKTEKVTFENGIEAMQFEGMNPDWAGDGNLYPVFGYSCVFENVNITIGYVLNDNTPELAEKYEEELQDIVYRIMTTIRIGKE